jgi:hypothetical protein
VFLSFPSKLGAFAPWREKYPIPSLFQTKIIAQATKILNCGTKFTEKDATRTRPAQSFSPLCDLCVLFRKLLQVAINALSDVMLRRSRRICLASPSEKQMLRGVYPEFYRRTQHDIHGIRRDRALILAGRT